MRRTDPDSTIITGEFIINETNGLDEPIPGDNTITEILSLDTVMIAPVRKPPRHRGKRRAADQRTTVAPYVQYAVIGMASLTFGLYVQLSSLLITYPLLAGISVPALVFAGALLAVAVIEKK